MFSCHCTDMNVVNCSGLSKRDVIACFTEKCTTQTFHHFLTIFSDLALNQPAIQISTAMSGMAPRAVDGINSTHFRDGSCTRTDQQDYPWWKVDLESSVPVAEVVIFACADFYCRLGLTSFEIRIGK